MHGIRNYSKGVKRKRLEMIILAQSEIPMAERGYHSDTQSSQNMCLQRSKIGACIFSWHIAQRSPAALTCIRLLIT